MATTTSSVDERENPASLKPNPALHSTRLTTVQRLRDLAWLCRQIYGFAPRHGAVWAITAIIQGLTTPIAIWSGSKLVNSIAAGDRGESATSPWLWFSIVAMSFAGPRIIDIFRFYAESVVREKSGPSLQALVFRKATGIDLGLLENQSFYDTTSRVMTEVETRAPKIVVDLQDLLISIPQLIGVMYLLITVDWRVAPLALITMLPNMIVFFKAGESAWNILTDQTRDRRLASYIASQITDRQAAKEIRLFGIQNWLLERWSQHFQATRDELRVNRFRIQARSSLTFFLTFFLSLAGFVWITLGRSEPLSPGGITILLSTFLSLPNTMFAVVQLLSGLGESSGLAADIRAFVELPTPHATINPERASRSCRVTSSVPGRHGALEINNLRFTYPGSSTPVIDGITLSIAPGERIAIVGENGAGKTTFLKLVLGLYLPDEGTLRLDCIDVQAMTAGERRRYFAAVFQQFTRYPLTIAENISMEVGPQDHQAAAFDRALDLSGLKHFFCTQETGLDTLLAPDLGGTDLSGGQWQRLAIARAGWRSASVLALDEPTAALDPMAEVGIFERFAELAQNRTTLLVSHRLGMARLADRIVVIEYGRVIEDGSHAELVRANGRYAEMWTMQARWYQ